MKTIILGGGAASMTTASKLRRNDKDMEIIVYQKEDYVSLGACGIPYYISDEINNVDDLIARTPEKFAESNIQIKLNHQVIAVDFSNKIVTLLNENQQQIIDKYDYLVIGVGASPFIFPFKNLNLENIFTAVSKQDALSIKKQIVNKKRVAIIGAGFIGLELVETFKCLNKEVILLESLDRIAFKNFDSEITEPTQDYLKELGVELHLNIKVIGFEGKQFVEAIVLEDGTNIKCDIVILALGFRPNTKIFQNTDLKMLNNGAIIIDKQGKTNIKDVYSLGDCATINNIITNKPSYIPLATTAIKLGKVVANSISNKEDFLEGTLGSSILQICDLQIAKTGLSEVDVKNENINYDIIFIKDFDLPGYMPKRKPLFLKLIYEKDTKKILGAQMLGYNKSVLRINALAVAISNKMTLSEIVNLDLVYAPPFSRTSDIIHIAASKIKK